MIGLIQEEIKEDINESSDVIGNNSAEIEILNKDLQKVIKRSPENYKFTQQWKFTNELEDEEENYDEVQSHNLMIPVSPDEQLEYSYLKFEEEKQSRSS